MASTETLKRIEPLIQLAKRIEESGKGPELPEDLWDLYDYLLGRKDNIRLEPSKLLQMSQALKERLDHLLSLQENEKFQEQLAIFIANTALLNPELKQHFLSKLSSTGLMGDYLRYVSKGFDGQYIEKDVLTELEFLFDSLVVDL